MARKSSMEPVSFEILDLGRARERLDKEIRRAIDDVIARPDIQKVRKVTFQIEIKPEVDDLGTVSVDIGYQIKPGLPPVVGCTMRGILDGDDVLVNTFIPGNNAAQATILDLNREEAESNA